jgi:hypothetical protein
MSDLPFPDPLPIGHAEYRVRVTWADGQETTYEGIQLSVAAAALGLTEIAEALRKDEETEADVQA